MLIECVPNVSEGRDHELLKALAAAIEAVPGVRLLHMDPNHSAHRTVFTFAGQHQAVILAAEALVEAALARIDMRQHRGVHPRMGAVDVLPFVALEAGPLAPLIEAVHRFGKSVAARFQVPVYFYEKAAQNQARRGLYAIRKGGFEGLPLKMMQPGNLPDCGPSHPHSSFGAAVVGVRNPLVAFNINLADDNLLVARRIARRLRASGYVKKQVGGSVRVAGMFPGLQAIGWSMPEFGCAQISTNILDPERAPLAQVYTAAEQLARTFGSQVSGSELVGLIPQTVLETCGKAFASRTGESCDPESPDTDGFYMNLAARRLGLNQVKPFVLEHHVLERVMHIEKLNW